MPRPIQRPKRTLLARCIRLLREIFGENQESFAARMNVTMTSVGRYETGAPAAPSVLANLASLAKEKRIPFLTEIFEGKLPLELADLALLEHSAAAHELRTILERAPADEDIYNRVKIMLAIACANQTELEQIERVIPAGLSGRVEDRISTAGAAILRSRSPQLEALHLEYLKSGDVGAAVRYLKAFEQHNKTAGFREFPISGFRQEWAPAKAEATLKQLIAASR